MNIENININDKTVKLGVLRFVIHDLLVGDGCNMNDNMLAKDVLKVRKVEDLKPYVMHIVLGATSKKMVHINTIFKAIGFIR